MVEPLSGVIGTWCPECGPKVAVDEDGCCAACGATATGDGVDALSSTILALQADVKSAEATASNFVDLSHKAMKDSDRLREALEKYGRHRRLCGLSSGSVESECTCGLDREERIQKAWEETTAALAALESKPEGDPTREIA